MSKDRPDALDQLPQAANYVSYKALPPDPQPLRGEAPAVTSSAPLPGGQAGEAPGSEFTTGAAKTITSTDGLFTFFYPATLETTIAEVVYTVGVIKKLP